MQVFIIQFTAKQLIYMAVMLPFSLFTVGVLCTLTTSRDPWTLGNSVIAVVMIGMCVNGFWMAARV